jgi:hypothetical protein
MSFFLLTYKRGMPREDPTLESFEDPLEAMETFVAAERMHRDQDDGHSVVLLIADDEVTLRQTHSHYFASADAMLERWAPRGARDEQSRHP